MIRIVIGLLLIVVAAPGRGEADVVRRQSVPEVLWGTWAPAVESCDAENQSRFTVDAKSYVSSTLTCKVDWVAETAGGQGSAYAARLICSKTKDGGGEFPSNVVMVPKDRQQILAGSDLNNLKVHQRCP
jgi:hypothetical protein